MIISMIIKDICHKYAVYSHIDVAERRAAAASRTSGTALAGRWPERSSVQGGEQ
jgi:hypothetical protein